LQLDRASQKNVKFRFSGLFAFAKYLLRRNG